MTSSGGVIMGSRWRCRYSLAALRSPLSRPSHRLYKEGSGLFNIEQSFNHLAALLTFATPALPACHHLCNPPMQVVLIKAFWSLVWRFCYSFYSTLNRPCSLQGILANLSLPRHARIVHLPSLALRGSLSIYLMLDHWLQNANSQAQLLSKLLTVWRLWWSTKTWLLYSEIAIPIPLIPP